MLSFRYVWDIIRFKRISQCLFFSLWVGPPGKLLAISPAPTPATGLGYRIFRDKSITLYANHENKYIDSSGALGYTGIMNIYKNGLDLTYLRGQVIALMKLSVNIQSTINKLQEEIKEKEENEKS